MTSGATYILFSIAGTTYGIRSEEVRHIEMVEQITPVPNASRDVDGVVFSRGQIVPVVNMRSRFGFERLPHDLATRLLVVQARERWVGLLVDSAREFVRVPASAIQPPGHAMADARYLDGVATLGERLVLLVKVEALLEGSVLETPAAAGTPDVIAASAPTAHLRA
jgi:purine-binding chemotaxis protein CheW